MKNNLFLIIGFICLSCGTDQSTKIAPAEMKEIIVKNDQNIIVLKTQTIDDKLGGACEWFDGQGKQLSNGTFKNGTPWNGTFVDWSLYFDDANLKTNPFDPKVYCKDWITHFESSFLSNKIDYALVIVSYKNGVPQ